MTGLHTALMNYNYEVVLWMLGRGGLTQENVDQALQIVSILDTPQEIVEKLQEKKNQRRQSTTVRIEARTEEFETVDAEDNLDFELIKNQLNEDAESIPIGEILFSEANTVLETNLWQSLNSTKLETDDLESVAWNSYY